MVLSKALTETYVEKPNDPIQFFAKYLLNHVQQQEVEEQYVKKCEVIEKDR
jgi:hypothetical protein